MKINKLIIKNINSLAGEHTVDFDNINDRSEGVYLIVGATGAGKTTILDAITLGLFGAVKRLGDISAGNIEKTGSIITHGARDARVDVVFSVKGNNYTARWQIRHKVRSAGWEAAQMSFYDANDQLLESGLSPVRKRIVEIIGMNFDQFNKAILLAQGDFASFLKSKFSEKADILEKITGTENYSKIGKAIYDKHSELKSEAGLVQNNLDNLSVLTDEELSDLNTNAAALNAGIKNHQTRINQVNTLINNRNNYTKEKELIKAVEEKLSVDKNELEILNNAHGRDISTFELAFPIKPVFDQINLISKEQTGLQDKKNVLIDNLSKISTEINKVLNTAEFISSETIDEQNFLAQLRTFTSEILNIENEVNKSKSTAGLLTANLESEVKRSQDDTLAHSYKAGNLKVFAEALNNKNDELKKSIELLKKSIGHEVIDDGLLQQSQDNLKRIESLQYLTQKYRETAQITKTIKENCFEQEEVIKVLSGSLDANKIAKINLQNIFNDKQIILRQQDKIKSLEHHRNNLKPGEDCPLCGAADGPLRHDGHSDSDQFQIDFDVAKKALDDNNNSILKDETKLAEIQKFLAKLIKDLEINNEIINNISKDINSAKDALKITESLNDKQILILRSEKITEEINAIKYFLKLQRELPFIQQSIILNEELSKIEEVISLLTSQLKNKFPLDISVNKWAEEIEYNFEQITALRLKSELELSNLDTLFRHNESQLQNFNIELNNFLSQNNIGSIAALENIFSMQSEVEMWKSQIDVLQRKVNSNETIFHSGMQRIAELEPLVDLNVELEIYISEQSELNEKITLESQELGGIRARLAAHESNVIKGKQLQEELARIETLLSPVRILNNLIGSATGHEFKKIAQKITLSHLAVLANKHLTLMNDRYKFKFDTKELWSKEEADLMIQDSYDPEGLRACTTLSGGETFIASLALALGLSDFASETSKIESLFIDEGFGTLDPDTLEMAIGALEKIRSVGNKTLCLITHVEAMKERIPYHLVVEKGSRGTSSIRFELN